MSALFQNIPLQPIRCFHYHVSKGRSKVKSGIAHKLLIEDAFSSELEPPGMYYFNKPKIFDHLFCWMSRESARDIILKAYYFKGRKGEVIGMDMKNMELTVTKIFDFACAHNLTYHEGKCKFIHGQNIGLHILVIGM